MSASVRNTIAWILQVLLGLVFILSGFNKLTNLPISTVIFESMGLPSVLAYVVGGAELLAGIGLIVSRRLARWAALGLLPIMIVAVFLHATKIPGGLANGIPAVTCLVLLGVVMWLRWPTTVSKAA
ncbi:MAG: DoxX family membrane protein [Hymenobacter sp.]|nr:MAG: DoxX family membrane protein [Hymenobacter sp.]